MSALAHWLPSGPGHEKATDASRCGRGQLPVIHMVISVVSSVVLTFSTAQQLQADPTQQCSSARSWMPGCQCVETTVLLRDATIVNSLRELLKTKYTVKLFAQIGDGDQQQEAVNLNRVVRYVPKDADGRMAMECEPERHVDVLLTEWEAADKVRGAATPRVQRSEEEVIEGR